jgi:hypothetical protein
MLGEHSGRYWLHNIVRVRDRRHGVQSIMMVRMASAHKVLVVRVVGRVWSIVCK